MEIFWSGFMILSLGAMFVVCSKFDLGPGCCGLGTCPDCDWP